MKRFLLSTLFALSTTALAEDFAMTAAPAPTPAPAPACDIVRYAQATVLVYKNFWTQTNGIWVRQSQEIGRMTTDAPVIGASMDGCHLNSLRLDNVLVNGKPETINVNAYIRLPFGTSKFKRFAGNYWVSVDTGRAGWGAADSEDASVKKLNVLMNLERANDASTAHDDVLTVMIQFNDVAG